MFHGKNLQVVRMLQGLSRKELGEKLNVSEQSIWQFEKQMIEPSFETNVAYRKADVSSRKKINSEVVYLNVAAKIINYLESFVNVPPNTLLALRKESFK